MVRHERCFLCSKKRSFKISLHQFPKNPDLQSAWIKFCNLNEETDNVSNLYLCSSHFTRDDYLEPRARELGGLLKLKPGTVPSMFRPQNACKFDQSIALGQQKVTALSTSAKPIEGMDVTFIKSEELIIKEENDALSMNLEPFVSENDITLPIKEERIMEESYVTIPIKEDNDALPMNVGPLVGENDITPPIKKERIMEESYVAIPIKEENDALPLNVGPFVGENDITLPIEKERIMEESYVTIPIKEECIIKEDAVIIPQKNASSPIISIAHRQTQTCAVLSLKSSSVDELRRQIKNLRNENRRLKRRIEKLEEANHIHR